MFAIIMLLIAVVSAIFAADGYQRGWPEVGGIFAMISLLCLGAYVFSIQS